jgi:hypothetical protein
MAARLDLPDRPGQMPLSFGSLPGWSERCDFRIGERPGGQTLTTIQNGIETAFRVKWPDAELLIEIRYR